MHLVIGDTFAEPAVYFVHVLLDIHTACAVSSLLQDINGQKRIAASQRVSFAKRAEPPV